MTLVLRRLLLAALCGAASLPAQAARPMITDDARIVDTQACQVESWYRGNRGGAGQFWAVPACTPVDRLELSWGGALARPEDQAQLSDSLAQAKLVLRPLVPNEWGLSMTLGRALERRPASGRGPAASDYLNVPLSFSRRDDALLLHLNLGLRRDQATSRDVGTWGLSTELEMRRGLQLIAETYGERGSRPWLQGGLRYWLVPDRVQLDTTYGVGTHPDRPRWFTIGVRVMSPPFLP